MSGQVTLGKSTWRLLLILALLSVGIAIAGYAFYSFQRDEIIRDKRDDLTTIADLKVAQIANWRRERIADAVVVSQTPFFTRSVKEFLDGAAPPQRQDEIQQWMLSLRDSYGYKDVLLLDERRQVRLLLIGRDTLPCADSLRERRLLAQRYQHLTRHANDIILLLDADGCSQELQPACQQLCR